MKYEELLRRLAVNLRDLRYEKALTQEDIAHAAGLSARGYAALERGQTMAPALDTLHAVAEALGVDVPRLLGPRPKGPRPKPLKAGRRPKTA